MEGLVVRVIKEKGFGFIKTTDGGEYFFHKSGFYGFFEDLVVDFEIGRKIKVTFESVPSQKGLRAENVIRKDSGI